MMQLQDPQYKMDDGAALRIWRDAAPNRFLTEQLARPVFDDVIFCEVIAPGSGNSTPVFELERVFDENMEYKDAATGENALRGPKYRELEKFIDDFKRSEKGDGSSMAGTPLEQWPEMNRSLVASLKAQGVYTVDALSVLPDGKLNVVGPDGRSWREKAKAYLENAKGGAYATGLAAELEAARVSIEDGKRREGELAARVAELENMVKAGTAEVVAKPAKAKSATTAADAVAEAAAAQAAPVGVAPVAQAGEGETLMAAEGPKGEGLQPII